MEKLEQWTYLYSYKMELINFVPRVGKTLTGMLQSHRECSSNEINSEKDRLKKRYIHSCKEINSHIKNCEDWLRNEDS